MILAYIRKTEESTSLIYVCVKYGPRPGETTAGAPAGGRFHGVSVSLTVYEHENTVHS